MIKFKYLTPIFATLLLQGCTPSGASDTTLKSERPAIPTPKKHPVTLNLSDKLLDDWRGDYVGILPCEDCRGIQTQLALFADQSYALTEIYLGTKHQFERQFVGDFEFDPKQRSTIVLKTSVGPKRYFIGTDFVELRQNSNVQKFVHQPHYQLTKVMQP